MLLAICGVVHGPSVASYWRSSSSVIQWVKYHLKNIMQWFESEVLLCVASQTKRNIMKLKEVQTKLVRISIYVEEQKTLIFFIWRD